MLAQPQLPDIEIPVEPVINDNYYEEQDIEDSRTIEYTEDLWEITDGGIVDDSGRYVDEFDVNDDVSEVNLLSPEKIEISGEPVDEIEAYRQSIIENWGGKKQYAEKRLEGVRENLEEQRKRFKELENQIATAESLLEPIREQVDSLKGQIEVLNQNIRLAKEKITNTEVLIAEKQIEIKDLMLNLKKSEIEMDIQKKIVMDYVKLLYAEEQQYFNLYDEGASTLKLLLADASVSENLLGQEYMKIMEETGRDVFYDLELKNRELISRQNAVYDEQEDLEFLYGELLKEKKTIEETRLSKKELLEKTQGEEERYQMMLEEAIQEQLETSIAVQNLQENLQLIEAKLATLDEGLDTVENVNPENIQIIKKVEEDIGLIEQIESEEISQIPDSDRVSDKPFVWPVPANKITAEFHDPTYPKRWGLHQAVDIRAKQFTEIRAPANAYVFQTKDNGNGYSYIILAHKGNLVTVYGHVSEIIAKPGTVVKQGEVIGLSGGTPGTKGAGLQTTGPHLHFEVHYKGEPVNPLDYLPLGELPIEYVPDEFLKTLY
ncbi:peptidoglycan DD-metalloendopeptidase family protein [Candidatus Peregrinibacteria bacterium]|nr:peptidoglycan DD-metalloendopeptidase family protein [Candidatus Peregrinibacteria bacterium]